MILTGLEALLDNTRALRRRSSHFASVTVGRQPLDGKNDYAHDPEEDPRILRRPVQWDERQNDQYRTDSPLHPIVQSDRNEFDDSSREVGQNRHE